MPIFVNGQQVYVGPGSETGSYVSGDFKKSVRLASTADLPLSGLAAVDGVAPSATDRVLAKNQTDATENGVYLAASGAWTRASDFDEDAEVTSGATVFAEEGTVNSGDGFTLVTADPIVVGTTALTFAKSFGSTIIPHASGHVTGGGDIIDGDIADITYVPTNYTRDTSPAEVTLVTELTSHLKGIDVALASAGGTEVIFEWTLNGAIATGTAVDGARIARQAGTIVGVTMFLEDKGGATGSTIADIHRHVPTKPITTQRDGVAGVTIYTTQGDRPTLVGEAAAETENAVIEAATPAVTAFVAGDFFTMDIDAIATSAPAGLVVQLHVLYS